MTLVKDVEALDRLILINFAGKTSQSFAGLSAKLTCLHDKSEEKFTTTNLSTIKHDEQNYVTT